MRHTIIKSVGLFLMIISFVSSSEEEWIKTQTTLAHKVENGSETSAKLKNLSPAAIEMGLRDTQLIADIELDEKNQILSYQWHSLVKEVNGTTFAQALTEPLSSQVKVKPETSQVGAGQILIATGDIDSMLNDYKALLAKAEKKTEVDQSSTLNQDSKTENDNRSSGGQNSGGGALGSGGNGFVENPEVPDTDVNFDQIVQSVEACSKFIDLSNMVISEQERVIKTSTETGEVVERGECQNIGQAMPIRKDFQAGCETRLDEATGTLTKGFQYYAMVNGSRFDVSQCEWATDDSISYQVMKDFEACPLEKAVVNSNRGEYKPAFVEYTTLDGQRYDLSECITSDSVTKELPTKLEKCEDSFDLATMKAYEQERTDTYDPKFKTVLKRSECINTGTAHNVTKDFDVEACLDLPNYLKGELYRGFQYVYTKSGETKYIDDCVNDMDSPTAITQEIGECVASVSMDTLTANVKKRWFFNDEETGVKTYVSECMESDESYPVVTTEQSCTPEYLSDLGKVVIKNRTAWKDSNDNWRYISDCRPSGNEAEIKTEMCSSPKYEHDFVGGQSYPRSRDYYVYNGANEYINSCSRDTSESYSHSRTASGCASQHDDGNMRSRLLEKTVVNLPEGLTTIKECQAGSNYIPYTYVGTERRNWPVVGSGMTNNWFDIFRRDWNYIARDICNIVKASYPSFTWSGFSSSVVTSWGSIVGWRVTANTDGTVYRRFDGSTYYRVTAKNCDIKGYPPARGAESDWSPMNLPRNR